MCNYIHNLLYENEWMKNTNILYVHCMHNMLHVTCIMQLSQKLVAYNICKMIVFF
jgi:hypothetical protein